MQAVLRDNTIMSERCPTINDLLEFFWINNGFDGEAEVSEVKITDIMINEKIAGMLTVLVLSNQETYQWKKLS